MAVDESERIRRLRIQVKATGRSVSVEKTLTVLVEFMTIVCLQRAHLLFMTIECSQSVHSIV